jgi:hypothetical protein
LTAGDTAVSKEHAERWRRELAALQAIDWPTLSAAERERKKARRRT